MTREPDQATDDRTADELTGDRPPAGVVDWDALAGVTVDMGECHFCTTKTKSHVIVLAEGDGQWREYERGMEPDDPHIEVSEFEDSPFTIDFCCHGCFEDRVDPEGEYDPIDEIVHWRTVAERPLNVPEGMTTCSGCGLVRKTDSYTAWKGDVGSPVELCADCAAHLQEREAGECAACGDESREGCFVAGNDDPAVAERFPLCSECRGGLQNNESPIAGDGEAPAAGGGE